MAQAISPSGDIVSGLPCGSPSLRPHAVWHADGRVTRIVRLWRTMDINARGEVLGMYDDPAPGGSFYSRAAIWTPQRLIQPHLLLAGENPQFSEPIAISDRGHVLTDGVLLSPPD
jgi:hypothetical protein